MKNNSPRIENSSKLRCKMTEVARDFRKEPTKSAAILKADLVEKDLFSALEIIRMKIKALQSQAHKSPSSKMAKGRGRG